MAVPCPYDKSETGLLRATFPSSNALLGQIGIAWLSEEAKTQIKIAAIDKSGLPTQNWPLLAILITISQLLVSVVRLWIFALC
jgi:hypothetical protein